MSTHTYYATDADPTDRPANYPTADRTATGSPMLFDTASTLHLPNLFDRENQAIVETKR